MRRNTWLWMTVTLFLAAAAGYVLATRRDQLTTSEPAIRAFVLPPERADELRGTLSRLFYQKENQTMQAQALANGTILVRAPLSVMAGIEQLVKQMEKMPSAPKRVVHLDYWLVVGEAATSPDPGVAGVLAGAFAAIDKVDGPRRFRVLEHLASNSASGEEVRVKGISAESLATALVNDQDVSVKLDFQSRLGQVRSTTVVKPGQVLVLGQTAVAADTASDREKIAKAPANVYYVIRASLVE